MKLSRSVAAVAALSTFSVVAACGGAATTGGDEDSKYTQSATTGVTDDTIKIGITVPESGPLSSFGAVRVGIEAYFDKVNAAGGVTSKDGKTRKIKLVALDDAYDPSRAKTNVDKLVNSDKVFALAGAFGTATQLAARPVLEESGAPSLWIGSGNPDISDSKHPLLTGISVPTVVEGETYAKYLLKNKPNAKVAIVAQNGDFGRPFVEGFEDGIKGSSVKVVGTQTFEPTDTDLRQQITTLAATKADALFVVAAGNQAKQAVNNAHSAGWDPLMMLPAGASLDLTALKQLNPGAGDGLLFASVYKDLNDSAVKDDPAVQEYVKAFEAKAGKSSYPIQQGISGWLAGLFTVKAIENLEVVDRPHLVESAHNLDVTDGTLAESGIALQTSSPDDNYIIEGVVIKQYDAKTKSAKRVEVLDSNRE